MFKLVLLLTFNLKLYSYIFYIPNFFIIKLEISISNPKFWFTKFQGRPQNFSLKCMWTWNLNIELKLKISSWNLKCEFKFLVQNKIFELFKCHVSHVTLRLLSVQISSWNPKFFVSPQNFKFKYELKMSNFNSKYLRVRDFTLEHKTLSLNSKYSNPNFFPNLKFWVRICFISCSILSVNLKCWSILHFFNLSIVLFNTCRYITYFTESLLEPSCWQTSQTVSVDDATPGFLGTLLYFSSPLPASDTLGLLLFRTSLLSILAIFGGNGGGPLSSSSLGT